MSDRRILWRTNRKLSGLVIDAPMHPSLSKVLLRSEGRGKLFLLNF